MNAKEVNDIFNIPLVLIETDATSNVCFAETFQTQVCTPERLITLILNQFECNI